LGYYKAEPGPGVLDHLYRDAGRDCHAFLFEGLFGIGHQPLLEGLIGPTLGDDLLVLLGLLVHSMLLL